MANNRLRLDLTDIQPSEIQGKFRDFLNNSPYWRNLSDNSVMLEISNLLGGVAGLLTDQILLSAREQYPDTARKLGSITRLALAKNIRFDRVRSARGLVQFTLDSVRSDTVIIPQHTELTFNNISYTTMNQVSILPGSLSSSARVIQGSLFNQTITDIESTDIFPVYTILNPSLDRDYIILTSDNGSRVWTRVSTILNSTDDSYHFTEDNLENFIGISLGFGNNITGRVPDSNLEFIGIQSLGSSGDLLTTGNILSINSDNLDSNTITTITCTNITPISGGLDRDNAETIRNKLTLPVVNAEDAPIIVADDWERKILEFESSPGIIHTKVWGESQLREIDRNVANFNKIRIALYAKNDAEITTDTKRDLITFLSRFHSLNLFPEIQDAQVIPIDINLKAYVNRFENIIGIRDRIDSFNSTDYFLEENLEFGRSFRVSNYTKNLLESIPEIVRVTEDVSIYQNAKNFVKSSFDSSNRISNKRDYTIYYNDAGTEITRIEICTRLKNVIQSSFQIYVLQIDEISKAESYHLYYSNGSTVSIGSLPTLPAVTVSSDNSIFNFRFETPITDSDTIELFNNTSPFEIRYRVDNSSNDTDENLRDSDVFIDFNQIITLGDSTVEVLVDPDQLNG